MKKQIIVSSLFIVGGLFLSSVQAQIPDDSSGGIDFDALKKCPFLSTGIDLLPPDISSESGEVGLLPTWHECKVPTNPTDYNYKKATYARWTLVKQDEDGGKQIWAVSTTRGPMYVGYIENNPNRDSGFYTFHEATHEEEGPCNKKEEIVLPNGESFEVQMTLPEIGFNRGRTDPNSPLNFEFLQYVNYTLVVSNEDRGWFWSRSPNVNDSLAWAFRSVGGRVDYYYFRSDRVSVRCVGL